MRKAILLITIICFCFSVTMVFAQPEVTAAGVTPSIGMSIAYVNNNGNYNPGSAGANQIWDLSAMGYTSSSIENFVSPASTACSTLYTSSTIAIGIDQSQYFTYTSNVYQRNGYCSFVSSRGEFTDPIDDLRFPMNVNTNYTDSFSSFHFSTGSSWYVAGLATITVDGYGTLITPNGVFNDVLRVYRVEEMLGGPAVNALTVPYHAEIYWWIKDGFYGPIATLQELIDNNTDTLKFGSYLTTSVGLAEKKSPINDVILFPNPANNELNVQLDLVQSHKAKLIVYNCLGQSISQMQSLSLNAGNNSIKIDVNAFSNGIFHLQIMFDDGTIETKKFMISH